MYIQKEEIGMRIINYNPEKIEKEFEELKARAEKYNKRAAKSFKLRAAWVSSIVVALLIASIVSIVAVTMKSEPQILLIMLSIVLSVTMIGFLLYLISWIIDGQNKMSLTHEMSFAMKFWDLYHQGCVLEIEKDSDIPYGIVLIYENEHHYVRHKILIVKDIIISTEVKELTLDVDKGYLLKPYTPKNKPVVETTNE